MSYSIIGDSIMLTKEEKKMYVREYQQTDEFKVAKKRYAQSPKGKEAQKRAQGKYRQSDKGKAKLKRYSSSDKTRTAAKRYRQTDKGKVAIKASRRQWKESGRWLQSKHNISLDDYDKLLIQQEGKCKICSKKFNEKVPQVDHNHKTNLIRGLLCKKCNLMLGLAADSISILSSAIHYLEENDSPQEQT